VKIIVLNAGRDPVTIRHGDRIAQLVFAPVLRVAWDERETLSETPRGGGGFGHTGTRRRGDPA